jgi:hypothetical protein
VVEQAADGTQTCLDVAQTFTLRQLGKCHRKKLIRAGQLLQVAITTIPGHAFLELLMGKELDQLGEDRAPSVHPVLSLGREELAKDALSSTYRV